MTHPCKSKANVKMVILNESDQTRYSINVPHALIETSIALKLFKTTLLVLLLTEQTNVWICATEQFTF